MKQLFLLLLFLISIVAHGQSVPSDANEICPILIGQNLPEGSVQDINGKLVELPKSLKKQKTLIVYYRGGWCPYCTKQLSGLNEVLDEIDSLGFRMIGIAPQTESYLLSTKEKKALKYELMSDASMDYAKALGIAFELDEKTLKRYKTYNIDLEKSSGYTHNQLPVPTVLVIDSEGIVQFTYINPNYKVRLNPTILLAVLNTIE